MELVQPFPSSDVLTVYVESLVEGVMMATIVELAVAVLFVALVAVLYVWTRRTEAESIYEPRVKSEDEASALRLGIAMNGPSANVSSR
jgi:hypothetical protein